MLIIRGDRVKTPGCGHKFLLLLGNTRDGLFRSGDIEFSAHIEVFGLRVEEESEGRLGAIGLLDADEEGLVLFKDIRHDIEGIITAIHDIDALILYGIALYQRNSGILFIDEGTGLDNGVEIAVVTYMVHDIDVKLMITTLAGIIGDEGGNIQTVRRNVLVRAVNGNTVIAFEFGADRDSLIEAIQDGGEGLVCEFAALMDESGFGRAVQRIG